MAELYHAVELARDTAIQLLTLATGIVSISIAFAERVIPAKTRTAVALLATSWCGYLLSILFGIAVLLNLTGNTAIALGGGPDDLERLRTRGAEEGPVALDSVHPVAPKPTPAPHRTISPYEPNVRLFFFGQLLLFGFGSAVLVAFGVGQIRKLRARDAR